MEKKIITLTVEGFPVELLARKFPSRATSGNSLPYTNIGRRQDGRNSLAVSRILLHFSYSV